MTETPTAEEVRAELGRLYAFRHFRGVKLRRLLGFLVEQWLIDGGAKLTAHYIGENLKDEELTFEQDSDKWGYPRTRANLMHVRKRLRAYYETAGYADPVIIKLNPGSYAPVIARNPISTGIPRLDPVIERLILRAKTAIDARTLRGAWRAVDYYQRIPLSYENPRQAANLVFFPMAVAPIVPSTAASVQPHAEAAIAKVRASGIEPWECTFADACVHTCYQHDWTKALSLFELAITNSQGEARYFWWYTALLASQGRMAEAIEILESAIRHFSRTSVAARTDLALLQIMAGRFDDAEETLSASRDFVKASNPLLVFSFAILYEAQDRLMDATALILEWLKQGETLGGESPAAEEFVRRRDAHVLLNGMFALLVGRAGATSIASDLIAVLLAGKTKYPNASSLEIALGLIGVGQFDNAVESLAISAFTDHDPFAMWFHIFPPLRHLQRQPAFQALLKRLALPFQHVR